MFPQILHDMCRSTLPDAAVPSRITPLETLHTCENPQQEKALRRMLQQMSDDLS